MNNELAFRIVLGFVIIALVLMEFYYLTLIIKASKAGVEAVSDH